jgi:hypothetical protein
MLVKWKTRNRWQRFDSSVCFFRIERDGSMTDIQVKKDPGYGLGKAVRVLKS